MSIKIAILFAKVIKFVLNLTNYKLFGGRGNIFSIFVF